MESEMLTWDGQLGRLSWLKNFVGHFSEGFQSTYADTGKADF